jgi:hypothetical protein
MGFGEAREAAIIDRVKRTGAKRALTGKEVLRSLVADASALMSSCATYYL